jgi:hypothetical protein
MSVKLGHSYYGKSLEGLRKIFGPKRNEVTGEWRSRTVRVCFINEQPKYIEI